MQPVVTDADMLFGGTTRALFIHLDYAGLLRLHWSPRILSELSRALVATGRKKSMDHAVAHEQLMNRSVLTAQLDQVKVDRHEARMRAYVGDPGDAHVVACAYELISGGYYPEAQGVMLTTRNLRDYKVSELATMGIAVMHPDTFLMRLPLRDVADALDRWRRSLETPPDPEHALLRLARDGNPCIADALRAAMAPGRLDL